jgi:hypothetical protein
MRDYLSRLAGRVRHVTPALQPLLPSFFEPAKVGVSSGPPIEPSEIEQSSIAGIQAAAIDATPAAGVPSRSSPLDPPSIVSDGPTEKRQFESPVRTSVRDIFQAARTQPQKVALENSDLGERSKSPTPPNLEPSVLSVRPRSQEERKSDRPAAFPPGPGERVPAPPVTPTIRITPPTPSAVVPLSQSPPTPKPKDVSIEPIRPPVTRQQRGDPVNPSRPVEIRSVKPVNLQPVTAAKPVTSPPQTSIDRKRAEAQTKLVSPVSTAPEIHVTIGRIEVRAINSPAPVQAPPRKPELSLDDYLRTRNQRAV